MCHIQLQSDINASCVHIYKMILSLIQTLSVVQVFVVSYNTVCGQLLYVYLFTASHPKQLCAEDEDIITKVNEITGDSSSSPTALVHR